MDIYYIKWIDAFEIALWHTKEEMEAEFDERLVIESSGFLFRENEEYLSLLQNSGSHGNVGGMTCIPKNCIIEKRKL